MTAESEANIHSLDAAYKPFPTFTEWLSRTEIDTVRWERYNSALKKRTENLTPELRHRLLGRALNVAKRAAAIDTGAIEGLYEVDRGFTYTVALETAAWEIALAQKGAYVKSLFEAQLHAYDFVLDLVTRAEPISEAAIRALHQEVCRAQLTYRVMTSVGPQEQELPKGQYKILPNHVRTRKGTDHSYAPVDIAPAEMARLVHELRSDEFSNAHPVIQAAYAHYSFVVIHPFADGNGRVARALASVFTYRAISMPIVILSEYRESYLNALEAADRGGFQEFVAFILDRSLETISLVSESLKTTSTDNVQQNVTAIEGLYISKGGYSYEQVDKAAADLVQAIHKTVLQEISRYATRKITASSGIQQGNYPQPTGYRQPMGGGRIIVFSLASAAPIQATVSRIYGILLPKDPAGEDDILIVNPSSPTYDPVFSARVDELIPSLRGILQIRLTMFAERVANDLFSELKERASASAGRHT